MYCNGPIWNAVFVCAPQFMLLVMAYTVLTSTSKKYVKGARDVERTYACSLCNAKHAFKYVFSIFFLKFNEHRNRRVWRIFYFLSKTQLRETVECGVFSIFFLKFNEQEHTNSRKA